MSMTDQIARRIALVLDESRQQKLRELAELHGSQVAAIRAAIDEAHAGLAVSENRPVDSEKRQAFLDWLAEKYGEPTESDEEWGRRLAAEEAEMRASMRR